MTEPTEEPKPQPSKKTQRTPEQLAVLAKAREKANQIRKENAIIRAKEKELLVLEKANKKKDILTRHADAFTEPKVVAPVAEVAEEKPIQEKKTEPVKPKERKIKKIIYESESSSDEEQEVIVVRKPKPVVKQVVVPVVKKPNQLFSF